MATGIGLCGVVGEGFLLRMEGWERVRLRRAFRKGAVG